MPGKESAEMGDGIEIREEPARPLAALRRAGVKDVGPEVPTALGAVAASLQRRGLRPAGPPVLRYFDRTDAGLTMEFAYPTATPVEDDGEVRATSLPAGRVASFWHIGPYHLLGEAWARFHDALRQRGHTPARGGWEVYWMVPGGEPDAARLRTELVQPIRG
jgi:effector-binding domain-containing protein